MGMWSVYLHKNKINGKVYIGITGQNPEKRWGNNGYNYKIGLFKSAIDKYGWDAFEHKILFTGLTKLDAEFIEVDLIHYYKKIGLSYNLADGGNVTTGLVMSDEARKHISDGHKGLKHSEETKNKIGKANSRRSEGLRKSIANKNKKAIVQYDLDGNLVKEWPSAKDVENELGFGHQNISKCLKGKIGNAYGYIWKYID